MVTYFVAATVLVGLLSGPIGYAEPIDPKLRSRAEQYWRARMVGDLATQANLEHGECADTDILPLPTPRYRTFDIRWDLSWSGNRASGLVLHVIAYDGEWSGWDYWNQIDGLWLRYNCQSDLPSRRRAR